MGYHTCYDIGRDLYKGDYETASEKVAKAVATAGKVYDAAKVASFTTIYPNQPIKIAKNQNFY